MVKKRIVSQTSYVDPSKAGQQQAAGTGKVYQGTLEAQWECSACGRTGIPGRMKSCPSCGKPKRSEQYEAPAGKADYLTPEELKAMGVDPTLHLSDEECGYCGGKLKPGTQKCPNCGAALGDVGYTTHVCPSCGRESNAEQCPACGAATEEKLVAHREAEPQPAKPVPAWLRWLPPFLQKPQVLIPLLIVLGLACFCVISGIIASIPKTETATVTNIAWERSIAVQEYQYVERGDWSLPAGADLVNQEMRIYSYNRVQVGTEERCGYEQFCDTTSVYDHTETVCYDDGTCDEHDVYRDEQTCSDEYVCDQVPVYEDVPIYETWYVYNMWEWVDLEPIVTRGSDIDIYWPETRLGETQNEGTRTENCIVTFTTEKGNSYTYRPPCSELYQYPRGSRWNIKRNVDEILEVQPQG